MHKILFLTLLYTVLLQSCYKDEVVQVETRFEEYPEIIIESTNLSGKIIHNDQTIPEIESLVFNGEEYNFYQSYFNFKNNDVNRNFEVLEITLQNGFVLSYPLNNFENTFNKHLLEIPKIENSVPILDQKYKLSLSSGGEINFQANNFENSGTSITDPIVYFEEINQHTIPGNNQGISENEETILLNNSEIFYLGWKESSHYLNPETVEKSSSKDLFYLDPSNGQWRIKNLTTSFFPGFYALAEAIIAKPTIINLDTNVPGNEIVLNIKLEQEVIASYYLPHSKSISCFVPFEKDFEIEFLYKNQELLKEEFFKTNDEDINLNAVNTDIDFIEISVSPRNCSNVISDNVLIEIDNSKEYYPLNSELIKIIKPQLEFLNCRIVDVENQMSTEFIPIENRESLYLGRQFLCEDVDEEYVFLLTEGNSILLTDVDVFYNAPNMHIKGINVLEDVEFNVYFEVSDEGILEDMGINVSLDAPSWSGGYSVQCNESNEGCGFTDFNVKLFEQTGSSISKIIFDGNFWMESIQEQSVGFRRMVGEIQIILP